jgi:hypothetical protein
MLKMCVSDSPLSTGSYGKFTKIQKYCGGEQLVNNSVGRACGSAKTATLRPQVEVLGAFRFTLEASGAVS